MNIDRFEAWTVSLPLPRPVVLGSIRYDSRDYVVLRLTDADGVTGAAWGMTRGGPLLETAARLAPLVVGADVGLPEALWQELYAATITYGQRGLSMRALSLVDIALWDLRARRSQLPLWQMLGGARPAAPAAVGGGYFREQREPDEIREELGNYVAQGVRIVKVPGGGLPPAQEQAWIELVREAVGPDVELAVDAHWSWREVRSALAVLRRWEPAHLAWVEDPLWPEAVAAQAALRRATTVPLAIGDELSGRWAYQNLLLADAADIWRIDVTTVGGFSEARRIAALAATWGIALSTHVYPELHVHLAAAETGVLGVEYTDPMAGIDLCYQFLDPVAQPVDGQLSAPAGHGLGVDVDWDLVAARSVGQFSAP
jgi:L-alanine-DL-glutamate epimerase-like enolase superfamily enzyme